MKYSELNKKSDQELKTQAQELREELFHLRIKHKTGQLENKGQINSVRRDIARVETRLTQLKNESAAGAKS